MGVWSSLAGLGPPAALAVEETVGPGSGLASQEEQKDEKTQVCVVLTKEAEEPIRQPAEPTGSMAWVW